MKIFHKGKDISTLVKKITWSGSRMQVARKLVFDYVQDDRDPNVPVLVINNGETVFGYDEENNIIFRGNVFDVEKNRQNSNVRITAFDNLFILSKSKTTKKFVNITAEDITTAICRELGVKVGNLIKTGVPVSFIADRKTGYQIIMMAYTEVSKKTGEKYHPIMNNDQLDIILKGTLIENYVADSRSNMTESTYKESIENMINQIMITDQQGNMTGYKRNDEWIDKYSMIQDVYKTDPNKDTNKEVEAMLKGPDRSGSLTLIGDYRVKSSYSIEIRDSLNAGKFWVKSDVHTFQNGNHMMKIELEFENMMNEEKAPQEKTKK